MNRFHLSAKSGIIAGAVSANAVLFAWRNSHASKWQFLEALTVKWATLTRFPTEQEIALALVAVNALPDVLPIIRAAREASELAHRVEGIALDPGSTHADWLQNLRRIHMSLDPLIAVWDKETT